VYQQQQQQQEQQQEQQDAENPFLDPPFSRIKILRMINDDKERLCIWLLTIVRKQEQAKGHTTSNLAYESAYNSRLYDLLSKISSRKLTDHCNGCQLKNSNLIEAAGCKP
jgi:hypothetical protein